MHRVEVVPENAVLDVDDTTRLAARTLGREGQALVERLVDWRSLDERVAVVDEDGLVRGVSPGSATVVATSEGRSGSASVTVTAPPEISLTPDEVEFAGVEGGPDPAARTVVVTNSGDGSLSGLTAAVEYEPGAPGGWLAASLGATAAPTALSLSASIASLPPGAYSAAVRIGSPAARNTPQVVSVRLDVGARSPRIRVSPSSVTFETDAGGADPAPVEVALTNDGGGTLTGLSLEFSYPPGRPGGWLSAELAGTVAPTTVRLGAARGDLEEGTYSASLRVTAAAASNSPIEVPVTFVVGPPAPPPPPGAPSELTAGAVSSSRVDLAWRASSGSVAEYEVERKTGATGTYGRIARVGGDRTDWQDASGLAPGSEYHYRVRACNESGCSSHSNEASATTFESAPPGAPTSLVATAVSPSRIDLRWEFDGVALSFEVQRSEQPPPNGFTTVHTTASGTVRTYPDTGLAASTTFYYRVRACVLVVCSGWSEVAAATTHAAAGGS